MRRGEIWTISSGGDFTGKPRPALVIHDDRYQSKTAATFLPLTTTFSQPSMLRVGLEPTTLNGLREASAVQVNRIAIVKLDKVGKRLGRLDETTMAEVDRALAAYLGLTGRGAEGQA